MLKKKIEIRTKCHCTVFTFYNENHTLGNILKNIIYNNPCVDYISYTVPQPSENLMSLRVKCKIHKEIECLLLGLKNANEMAILVDNLFCINIEMQKYFV